MAGIELDYTKRKTAVENIAAAINDDGAFQASTWCKPTTKSGYPAVNGYIANDSGQFMVFSVSKGGFVNIRQLVEGTDNDVVEAALTAIQKAAGLELPPRIHPDYTNIVPHSQLNKAKDEDVTPNTVSADLFKPRGKARA